MKIDINKLRIQNTWAYKRDKKNWPPMTVLGKPPWVTKTSLLTTCANGKHLAVSAANSRLQATGNLLSRLEPGIIVMNHSRHHHQQQHHSSSFIILHIHHHQASSTPNMNQAWRILIMFFLRTCQILAEQQGINKTMKAPFCHYLLIFVIIW